MSKYDPKLKTLNGVDIHVTPEGKFWAIVGIREMERAKLSELERLILKCADSTEAIYMNYSQAKIVKVIGYEARTGQYRLDDRKLVGTYEVFRLDPETLSELQKIEDERRVEADRHRIEAEHLANLYQAQKEKLERLKPEDLAK